MGNVYHCSDFHLGHKNIPKYREQVSSVEHNDQFIIENWRAKKRDVVYMYGDMAFTAEGCRILQQLPGRKTLILGNHDFQYVNNKQSMLLMAETFEIVKGLDKHSWKGLKFGQRIWQSHAPLAESELRGALNIHGHIHDAESNLDSDSYFNVNLDAIYPKTGKIMLSTDEVNELWEY